MTTPQPDPKQFWRMLVSSVQLLAADYEEQVATLPDFVHVPDELALNFDDVWVLVPQIRAAGLLDESAAAQLEELHQSLGGLADWTLDALRNDPRWATIREQARAALAAMHEPRGPIDLSWGSYVAGKPSEQPG